MLRFWSMVLLASLLTGCGGGGAGTSGDSGSAARASNDTVDAPDPEVQEARRIRTAGMISLPAVVVNTTTAGVQSLQGVSALPDGGDVVRWRSEGSEYLQRFDATGDWVGSEKALPFGDAVLWSDGLLQVYASNRFVSATQNSYVETSGIYLRRYDWTGSPVGAEIVVSSITENRVSQEERNLRSPVTLNLDDGGFLVAWTLTTTSYTGTVRQFWLQLYDNVGQPVGSAVNFGRGDPTENATYSLAATSDGGFVVALQKSFFAARYVDRSLIPRQLFPTLIRPCCH